MIRTSKGACCELPVRVLVFYLLPIQSQLAEPVKGVYVFAASLGQLIDDVPGVDLHCDQSNNLQALDFGKVPADDL